MQCDLSLVPDDESCHYSGKCIVADLIGAKQAREVVPLAAEMI